MKISALLMTGMAFLAVAIGAVSPAAAPAAAEAADGRPRMSARNCILVSEQNQPQGHFIRNTTRSGFPFWNVVGL